MAKKPLWLDGVVGSQIRDTQGEILSVEGADISELAAGKGRWNDNHGKGFFNSVGRITEAKKILKSDDCSNDREKYYWDKVKAPFIYAKGYLYDDEDHPNAKAAAAILRNIHKSDCPLQLKASVEGGVVARGVSDTSLLARTKIHSVALTFTPANNNTLVEPLSLDKTSSDEAADLVLIKSVLHLAETNVPSFRHIARDASATRVHENLKRLTMMMKELGLEDTISIPSKSLILEKSLEQKILDNVVAINQRIKELNDQDEDLDKGIKHAIAGAALAAGVAGAPSIADAPTPSPQSLEAQRQPAAKQMVDVKNVPKSHQEVFARLQKENPALAAICFKESSGAKNYDHKTITDPKSMHFGHTAGGMCGMLPHAAALILKKDQGLAKKYPKLAEAAKDIGENHRLFTDTFNNDPNIAVDFATAYFNRNQKKTKNLGMLFHSWNNGLKGTWDKYKDGGMESIHNSPYVQDVMQHYNAIRKPATKDVKKALMAGYGGGGAPTSSTGGSVLQTESLGDGRVSFKYITCNKCGKEQIYAQHQVKCRGCGNHMSMEQLYSVMVPKKK